MTEGVFLEFGKTKHIMLLVTMFLTPCNREDNIVGDKFKAKEMCLADKLTTA